MTNKQAFAILAEKMDEREKPLEIIREMKAAGVDIPKKYKHLETMAERKHWRRDPKNIDVVKKAARKAAQKERAGKVSGVTPFSGAKRPAPPPPIPYNSGAYTHERAEPKGEAPDSREGQGG